MKFKRTKSSNEFYEPLTSRKEVHATPPPSSVASFWYGGGGARPRNVPTKNICTYIARASEASELLRNIYFQNSKYICIHIQSMQFPLITYGMALQTTLYWQNTNIKKELWICERASLENFTFSHSKTAISFNILLVLQILCLRNTFIFRSQIKSAYIYISMHFPFITYGIWCYI